MTTVEKFYLNKTESIKKLRRFLREHPEGATTAMMKEAGVSMRWLDYLRKHGIVTGEQIREPERGPRNYHWIFKETTDGNS